MKKEIFFITATNTDVGKSYACEIFLKKFASKNKKVGYFKPIETGVKDTPIDGSKLLKLTKNLNSSFDLSLKDIVPFQFELPAAPYVASGKKHIDINTIKEKLNYLLNFCDVLIVEGAGGLMVPINKNYFLIDLIKDLTNEQNCSTILISPSNLGSINDTLLSQKALQSYNIAYEWYINLYKDKESFDKVTLPFYKEYFDTIKFLQQKDTI